MMPTPGPWEASGIRVKDRHGDLVVESRHGVNHEQDVANARLIAAAPNQNDALAAVAQDAEFLTLCCHVRAKVRAALAEAKIE